MCTQWLSLVLILSKPTLLVILLTCTKMGFDTRRSMFICILKAELCMVIHNELIISAAKCMIRPHQACLLAISMVAISVVGA